MIKNVLLAAPVAALLCAGSALAADLPQRGQAPAFAPAPLPLFTWTGFYAGVNAGAGFGNRGARFAPGGNFLIPGAFPAGYPAAATAQLGGNGGGGNRNGFAGGGQIGYNYQVGSLVYGIEADLDFLSGRGRKTNTVALGAPFAAGTTLTTSSGGGSTYIGTVRGRFGIAYDRFLPYITGGLAYGNTRNSSKVVIAPGGVSGIGNASAFTSGSSDNVKFGYALGAGLEYAITNNFTVKGEYLYTDLGGRRSRTLTSGTAPGYTFVTNRDSSRNQQVRVGLNYKF